MDTAEPARRVIQVRMPEDEYQRAIRVAVAEKRTLSSLTRMAIAYYCDRHDALARGA